jgi:histidinol-phosphatase (PHP family)
MLTDYHIHTSLCGHAEGEPREYVKVAMRVGLDEVGFSDHLILHMDNRDYSMPLGQFPFYIEMIEGVQREFPEYPIKIGVEVDYAPGYSDIIRRILKGHPIDYVIGSVHCLGEWVIDDSRYASEYERRDIDEVYRQYFNLFKEAAASGLFDIMSHPDLPKKFGYKPKMDIHPLLEETADALETAEVCVEVNTSGLRKPVGEIYPSEEFLRLCHGRGIPIILGSDAHSPQDVGRDFDKALNLIRRVDYEEIATFSKRRRRLIKIDP